MSIDITYFSFNAKRADEGWKDFPTDIVAARKATYEPYKQETKNDIELRKIHGQVDKIYDEKQHQKRLEIFKSFADEGYFIPGKTTWEWDQDVDKYHRSKEEYEKSLMEYLLLYGMVYPGGIQTPAEQNLWRMLDSKTKEDYRQIDEERVIKIHELRDELKSQNPELFKEVNIEDKKIELTERQIHLKNNCDLSNLIYSDEPDENLPFEMATIDLYYGGISNDFFEENYIASLIMVDWLVPTFDLKHENGIPLRDELVRLYENLTKEMVIKLANVIAKKNHWDEEIGMTYALEFFKSMKPVVKDLKENPDSILVLTLGGDNTCKPKSSDKILLNRAEKHIKDFKGILPPIL